MRVKIINKEYYLVMYGRFNCKFLKDLIFILFVYLLVKIFIYVDINMCCDFYMFDYWFNLVLFLNIYFIVSYVKL